MRIGIIGGGVVGHATARCFMEHAEVRVFDTDPSRGTHTFVSTALHSDIVFVCLPTPQKAGSMGCDTTIVEKFFAGFSGSDCAHINLVLRSTVPIGFTRTMRERYGLSNLVHSPEFLTSRCAVTDAQIPARNIIGGQLEGIGCAAVLWAMYLKRFPGVPVLRMRSDESEAVKLMLNSFFAVKVAYFNECYALCQKLGLDWDVVREGILSDGRIAHAHTQVPGPDGRIGFGGTCLPKDLASFITCMRAAGHGTSELLSGAYEWRQTDGREPQECSSSR